MNSTGRSSASGQGRLCFPRELLVRCIVARKETVSRAVATVDRYLQDGSEEFTRTARASINALSPLETRTDRHPVDSRGFVSRAPRRTLSSKMVRLSSSRTVVSRMHRSIARPPFFPWYNGSSSLAAEFRPFVIHCSRETGLRSEHRCPTEREKRFGTTTAMDRARRGTSLVPDQLLAKTKHSRVHERPAILPRSAGTFRAPGRNDESVLSGGRCPRKTCRDRNSHSAR